VNAYFLLLETLFLPKEHVLVMKTLEC